MNMIKLKQLVKEELFKILSENRFIDKFKEFIGDEDVTDLDIEYFAYKNKLTSAQKALLKKTFLSDFDIKSTGPLPANIRGKIGK